MRAESLSLTEEASQLSTIISGGVFPQEYVCENDPVFSASSEMYPRFPDSKEGRIYLQRLNAGSSFISQDERMSESPVETLQKDLGLHLISTRGFISL